MLGEKIAIKPAPVQRKTNTRKNPARHDTKKAPTMSKRKTVSSIRSCFWRLLFSIFFVCMNERACVCVCVCVESILPLAFLSLLVFLCTQSTKNKIVFIGSLTVFVTFVMLSLFFSCSLSLSPSPAQASPLINSASSSPASSWRTVAP